MTEQTEKTPIRSWLARYKPTMVRCTLATNEVRELPTPKQGRGQWIHLERAITMLAPTYIEAFQGKTCVATRSMEVEVDDTAEPQLMPNVERKHPFATMIASLPTIVQLTVDAGDAACARQEASYKHAFEALITVNNQYLQLVKVISDRLGGLERAWHKMIIDRAHEVGGGGEENDGLAASVIGTILNNGRPNGAAPMPPKEPDE
jgi:hypothetical protein